MNKLFYPIALLISIGLFSCETDVEVNDELEDITVVYGLINPSDTVHYVKINSAFLGAGNALDLAANSVNFNYPENDLEIVVEEFDGSNVIKTFSTSAGTVIRTVNEIPKDPGIFDNSNNVLYKFIEPYVNRNNIYRIKVINKKLDKETTSETRIVKTTGITTVPNKFRFFNGSVGSGTPLIVSIGVIAGANVGRAKASLIFNYTEHYTLASGISPTTHRVVMPLTDERTTTSTGGDKLNWGVEGEIFFDNIRSAVSSPTSISNFSHRELNLIALEFNVAGTELSTFMEVNTPSTSVNQDKPNYTNINNGIGIFSSREKILWTSSQDETVGNIQANTISYLGSMGLGFCFSTGPLATVACNQL